MEVDAAGGFEGGVVAVGAEGDGLAELFERHVVEEDVVDAGEVEEGLDLFEAVGFEFDFDGWFFVFEAEDGLLECGDSAFGDEVVVFDHGAVVEADAVVGAAAVEDGLFFEESEAGGGFAGVEDAGLGAGDEFDVGGGEGGDAAEALEEVEGGAFGGEDGACGALDVDGEGAGGDVAAVGDEDFNAE